MTSLLNLVVGSVCKFNKYYSKMARLLAFALLASVMITFASARPNDLISGNRIPGDQLIQHVLVQKDASKLGMKVTVTRTFSGDGHSIITQVRALDQHTNGHGATATLIAGGVGYNYVTIKFESERFRAIDFVVELYGK